VLAQVNASVALSGWADFLVDEEALGEDWMCVLEPACIACGETCRKHFCEGGHSPGAGPNRLPLSSLPPAAVDRIRAVSLLALTRNLSYTVKSSPLLQLHGQNDTCHSLAAVTQLHTHLAARGAPHALLVDPGGQHEVCYSHGVSGRTLPFLEATIGRNRTRARSCEWARQVCDGGFANVSAENCRNASVAQVTCTDDDR
jgi:hypothetical protein